MTKSVKVDANTTKTRVTHTLAVTDRFSIEPVHISTTVVDRWPRQIVDSPSHGQSDARLMTKSARMTLVPVTPSACSLLALDVTVVSSQKIGADVLLKWICQVWQCDRCFLKSVWIIPIPRYANELVKIMLAHSLYTFDLFAIFQILDFLKKGD